jgi:plasmid stabilization system protein ParE
LVVRKLPLAEQDALDAAIWYEQRRPGLGDEFLDEVDRAVRALGESALHHRIRFAGVRRAPIHRFKFYGIYYTIREEEVWILAIFHGRRHPRRLQKRIGQVG